MEKNIFYKNSKIFYRVTGQGKPVILLHGFGEDGNIWNDLVEALQNNYRVIVPDIPGSGRSEILKQPPLSPLKGEEMEKKISIDTSIDDYAEIIKAICDIEFSEASPSGRFGGAIIGHSMGGYIALAFAKKYTELLNGLGLFHSSAFADDEQKIETRLKAIEFIKKNGAYEFLKTSIPGLFADTFKKDHAEEVEKLTEAGKQFRAEALIQYYQAMINRTDRTQVLKTFNKPILFIIGEKDPAVPLQASLQQCHLPAISHIHILQNAAHMGMIEEKEKCGEVLKSFIEYAFSDIV